MSTIQVENTKQIEESKLAKLRFQVYEEFMKIGAQVAAEKVIMNNLSSDSQFMLSNHASCMVGWARGTGNYSYFYAGPNERICWTCSKYSMDIYNSQLDSNSIILNPIPTEKFLNLCLEYIDHHKTEHKK